MKTITAAAILRETLAAELTADPTVMLMGEDIGVYGGAFGITRGLLDRFGPQRVIETPISENGVVGMAIGAAISGCRPIVEIMFADFVTLAMDPLVNQAAKLRYILGRQASCPLVVRLVAGGGRGYGPTHSQGFAAWFVHTPGLKVVAPSSIADHADLLHAAVQDPNPVVFLEHKRLYGWREPVPADRPVVGLETARTVNRGHDLTILAWSWMAVEAAIAAERLAADGITAEVIDVRCLQPLDMATINESVQQTGRVLIVDEAPRSAGIAAEIGCRVFEASHEYLEAPIRRLTAPDIPVPASPPMEQLTLPDATTIAHAAMGLMETLQ